MNTASELQRAVLEELSWEPSVDAAAVGVAATHEGVVTLSGHVHSYPELHAAEAAARRVRGVRGLVNELAVRLPAAAKRDDTEIARAAVNALRWNVAVPDEQIQVSVHEGRITLKGEVYWHFQREAAANAVRDLMGVTGVVNAVTLKPRVSAALITGKIEDSFRRSATVDSKQVRIMVVGNVVTLGGEVRSWSEYQAAEWAAWSAPGVVEVRNRLQVGGHADIPTVELAAP